MRLCALTFCLLLSACRCADLRLAPVGPEELRVAPDSLALPATYVGQSISGAVSIDNVGGRGVTLAVSVSPPFVVDVEQVSPSRGGSELITVSLTPETVGPIDGSLTIGPLTVPLTAEGLAVPQCVAEVCHAARFDFEQRQCATSTMPEGDSCQTTCVVAGQCAAGTCVGTLNACDDLDACTVDACSEQSGCAHVPRRCPAPSNPCQVATCDGETGCGAADVDDGTLCGPDDCLSPGVSVCVSGQCVARVRPTEARCTNTWVPTTLFARDSLAITYDPIRRRVLLFGGMSGLAPQNDTWEWDGAHWSMRTPPRSPPAVDAATMVWDSHRSRAVMVSVNWNSRISETWEWDGVTWLERDLARTLPQCYRPGLAYDALRRRAVAFGCNGSSDTWEWDGVRWEQKHPVRSPSPRSSTAMAYDSTRQRVVLFGGATDQGPQWGTWEWDGISWVEAMPLVSPPARRHGRMTWNAARQRVVLFGGDVYDWDQRRYAVASDFWEWDGTRWEELQSTTPPPARAYHGLAWDDARGELIAVAGLGVDRLSLADTWVWNGTSWQSRTALAPEVRGQHAMAFDERRGRVVLFGGRLRFGPRLPADTWEWDGASWSRAAVTGPSARADHAMAWDPLRQRVILFGGDVATDLSNETWEWDGTTWVQRAPATSPSPRASFAMAFDRARSQTVIVSASSAGDSSWVWDGTTWAPGLMGAPNMSAGTMAFDEVRQQLVFLAVDGSTSTWTLESAAGSTWQLHQLNPAPFPWEGHTMAYDRLRQRVILVGSDATTWEWHGTSWSRLHPGRAPPPSHRNALVYDAARQRLMLTGESGPWVLLP